MTDLLNTWDLLNRAFSQSQYLHSVGSGDVQAIDQLIGSATDYIDAGEYGETNERELVLAAGLAARALIPFPDAYQIAEEYWNALDDAMEATHADEQFDGGEFSRSHR